MAGMWEKVAEDLTATIDRVNVSLLRTELTGVSLNIRTRAEAKAAIETSIGAGDLTADQLTDLNEMAANFETGTTQDRLVYAAKFEYANNAAELGLINETEWRTVINIPAL